MDPYESLQDGDNFAILGCLDGFVGLNAVLDQRPPRYARGIGGGEGRQGLIFALEGLEGEKTVYEDGFCGEIRR